MRGRQHDMITRTNRRRTGRLTVVAAAVLAVAAGCSSEDIAERAIERQLENEAGQDVDIDLDDGNIRIETEDGTIEMNSDGDGNISIEGGDGNVSIDSEDGVTVIESDDGTATISQGAGVPDDFPESVPLPEGFTPEFSQSLSSADGDGWVLGGEIEGSPAEVGEAYAAALEAAGFERLQLTETTDAWLFTYDDGTYTVNGMAGAGTDGDATYFNVTVAESQS